MSFEDKLKQYISIDNEIKLLNEKIKDLKDKKTNLSNILTNYANENKLSNKDIKINNEKIKFTLTKIQQPLTFKYLESSLSDIIDDSEKVNHIINHIKIKRETRVVNEIKRYSNN